MGEALIEFAATFTTKVAVGPDEDLSDAIANIDIPENETCKYKGDSFTVLKTEILAPKECKGKAAARALAVMVLDQKVNQFLSENSPMLLEETKRALEPFGYPDLDALAKKLGL